MMPHSLHDYFVETRAKTGTIMSIGKYPIGEDAIFGTTENAPSNPFGSHGGLQPRILSIKDTKGLLNVAWFLQKGEPGSEIVLINQKTLMRTPPFDVSKDTDEASASIHNPYFELYTANDMVRLPTSTEFATLCNVIDKMICDSSEMVKASDITEVCSAISQIGAKVVSTSQGKNVVRDLLGCFVFLGNTSSSSSSMAQPWNSCFSINATETYNRLVEYRYSVASNVELNGRVAKIINLVLTCLDSTSASQLVTNSTTLAEICALIKARKISIPKVPSEPVTFHNSDKSLAEVKKISDLKDDEWVLASSLREVSETTLMHIVSVGTVIVFKTPEVLIPSKGKGGNRNKKGGKGKGKTEKVKEFKSLNNVQVIQGNWVKSVCNAITANVKVEEQHIVKKSVGSTVARMEF